MANGETIYQEGSSQYSTYHYVTTNDEDGVFLKASGTPGYYKDPVDPGDDPEPDVPSGGDTPSGGSTPSGGGTAVPATGDANMAVAMMCLAMFVCSLGALGVVRRRRIEE